MLFTKHILLFGRVQGVSFRESARAQAMSLGLVGWVRNRLDGSVEATVQGNLTSLQKFVKWSEAGPALAEVIKIEVRDCEEQHLSGFEIKPTV